MTPELRVTLAGVLFFAAALCAVHALSRSLKGLRGWDALLLVLAFFQAATGGLDVAVQLQFKHWSDAYDEFGYAMPWAIIFVLIVQHHRHIDAQSRKAAPEPVKSPGSPG